MNKNERLDIANKMMQTVQKLGSEVNFCRQFFSAPVYQKLWKGLDMMVDALADWAREDDDV